MLHFYLNLDAPPPAVGVPPLAAERLLSDRVSLPSSPVSMETSASAAVKTRWNYTLQKE